jgi:hypothetical protein
MKYGKEIIGKRIRMVETMTDEKYPIEKGEMGTIRHVGGGVINVVWDNGRDIGVIEDEDNFEIVGHPDTHLPPNNFLVFSGNI